MFTLLIVPLCWFLLVCDALIECPDLPRLQHVNSLSLLPLHLLHRALLSCFFQRMPCDWFRDELHPFISSPPKFRQPSFFHAMRSRDKKMKRWASIKRSPGGKNDSSVERKRQTPSQFVLKSVQQSWNYVEFLRRKRKEKRQFFYL